MKVRDMKISRILKISMAILVLMVLILGSVSFYIAQQLWTATQGLYEHPFTVQKALANINNDVMNIRLEIKEVVLENKDASITDHLAAVDIFETDAYKQLDILYGAYLGPISDLDITKEDMIVWKSLREETIRNFRDGNIDKARNQAMFDGTTGQQAIKIISDIEKVSLFADNKAKSFYNDAYNTRTNDVFLLIVFLLLVIIFASVISALLIKTITKPLRELKRATKDFQKGNLDAKSSYLNMNEFGALSESFNEMTSTVKESITRKENISTISNIMISNDNLYEFCEELLKSLMKHTQAQHGSFYMLDGNKENFILYNSIGISSEANRIFSAKIREGEFGTVLATKEFSHITDIPKDSIVNFKAFNSDLLVKEIVTIPIIKDKEIVMILSLGKISNFSLSDINLLEGISNELSARVSNVLNNLEIDKYSKELEKTNMELISQSKELAMQTDELIEQNIELEIQKKQLDEVSNLKSSFLSNMSHELRTPLNSVIALSSVLKRRLNNSIPSEEVGYLDVIERNGKNLLSLVNDLLDLSRIESGKEEVNFRKFKLNTLINDIIELLEPLATSKGIIIINETPLKDIYIQSDEDKLRHILQNIISNAIKFTDKGEVVVFVVETDDNIHISIKDTGIGIANDDLEIIFDEFRQADESSSRRNGGTGLGLAIAKKYAALVGGSISVDSDFGLGSIFKIKLPIIADKNFIMTKEIYKDLKKPIKKNNKNKISRTGRRILLVDDSEPAIIQTREILTEYGYDVFVASCGKEALEKIAIIKPDGMVLDLMMPGMNGFDVLKAVRDKKENEKIPVLILSAKHITKDELSFLKTNHVTQLIQKGAIDKDEFLNAVDNLVYERDLEESDAGENLSNKNNDIMYLSQKFETRYSRKPNILVVEDNLDNMTTIKAILSDKFQIMEAKDGFEGVKMALSGKVDLILMDISLPNMDGYQALNEIRTNKILDNIHVIALTARAMSGDMEDIMSHGFNDYQSKPIDEEKLISVIWRHINVD